MRVLLLIEQSAPDNFTTSNIHVRGSSPVTEYTHQIPPRNPHKYKCGKYNTTACHVSSKLVGVRGTRLWFSKASTSQHQAANRGLNDPFCDHQQSLSKFAWCAAASPLVRSKDLKSFSPGWKVKIGKMTLSRKVYFAVAAAIFRLGCCAAETGFFAAGDKGHWRCGENRRRNSLGFIVDKK